MQNVVGIVEYIFYILYRIIRLLLRILSFLIFALLILGVAYYFLKPDLPPQELRELGNEVLPGIFTDSKPNSFLSKILSFLEVESIGLQSTAK